MEHPLFTQALVSSLSAEVVAETTREIAEQSRGLLGVLLTASDDTYSAIDALSQQQQHSPAELVADDDSDAMLVVVSSARDALQTVAVEVEVGTMLTMALTFLHQRYALPN